jgi:hypothetical protein
MGTRDCTNKLVEAAEEGIISWEDIARECLAYMSESDVSDLVAFQDFFAEEDEEEEEK